MVKFVGWTIPDIDIQEALHHRTFVSGLYRGECLAPSLSTLNSVPLFYTALALPWDLLCMGLMYRTSDVQSGGGVRGEAEGGYSQEWTGTRTRGIGEDKRKME